MPCRTPSFGETLAERRPDFPLFEANDEKMLNDLPKLGFTEVRLHVIDDASFNNRFLVIGWITKMLERGIHGDDMSSWLAGAEALHQPTVCSNKN
jgi:hypothetical protein